MSRILIPDDLKGKALFNFLVANKSKLIATKKASIKWSDPIALQPSFILNAKRATIKKAAPTEVLEIEGERVISVKVSCNAAWFFDSQYDVLTDTCYDESIKNKGILIPHIADHQQSSTSHVGDVKAVYTQKIPLKDLGLDMPGSTTCAIMETDIREDYNPKTYLFYKNGKINQHSIGLLYLSIGMCINDKDYLPEYELWNKYYDKIINKDEVDDKGFFWIVPEIKWLENSCVLNGSNPLTTTLEIEDTEKGAVIDTHSQPSQDKNMVICPNCTKRFKAPNAGQVNCPDCGQYVSMNSTSIEVQPFDSIKAIRETIFIKN